MVLQNYQHFTEMTSNMIYIVAFGGGLKCPRKIHLNTQCISPLWKVLLYLFCDQAQAESDETSRQCIICMDKDLCVALRPCGHIVACEGCVGKLTRKCPTCRETIIGTLKIYLP